MKKVVLITLFTTITVINQAQLIARVEMKEDIPGICNKDHVYSLFNGFKGQVEPVCPLSKDEILKRLNTEVTFLKDQPKYKDKGMIGMYINCKGEVLQCRMDLKTKNPELDKQIEAVFSSLGKWSAGKLDGKEVDHRELFSFKIKKGIIVFE
jgi:hypothetical protein